VSATDAPPAAESPPADAPPAPARRLLARLRWPAEPPGWGVFAAMSAAVFAILLGHNSFVFSTRFYEGGDGGANSILAIHAKHFTQLVGNYSRIGFAHPGPAFIYVQAFGEWVFYDVFGVVPTPWNGQTIAFFLLNAVLAGITLAVLSHWFRSWLATALAAGVLLVYFGAYGYVVASTWMPWLYFAPFLLLLTAAASVAAGRVRDLWALALAAGLLVHGHAEFLFLAPVVVVAALAVLALRRWRGGVATLGPRRDWYLALGVVGLFALPIVANLVLHWPGEIGKYLAYSRSNEAGGHPLRDAVEYTLQFWPGHTETGRRWVVVSLFAAAGLLAWRNPAGPARTFLRTGVGFVALGSVLFVWYAANGIDHLDAEYVGHFAHALPVLLATLVAMGVATGPARIVPARGWNRAVGASAGVAAVAVGLLVCATSGSMYTPQHDNVTNLPQIMDVISRQAGDRPIVVDLPEADPWPEMVAMLLAGKRDGHRVCMDNAWWGFIVTDELICTPHDLETGEKVRLLMPDKVPDGAVEYGPLGHAIAITAR
jgi:hypothetical protein